MAIIQAANRLQRGGGSVIVNANGTISIVGAVALAGILTATGFIGPVTGDITGNADTATVLQVARTINGVAFDGSSNIVVTAAAGTLTGTTLNSSVVTSNLATVAEAAVTAHQAALAITEGQIADGSILARLAGTETITGLWSFAHASGLKTDDINERTATMGVSIDGVLLKDSIVTAALAGNASTATVLATARDINGVAFDGSGNIVVTAAAGTLTGATLKATVLSSSLTSLGTIASLVATVADIGALTVSGDLVFSSAGGNLAIGTGVLLTTATDGFVYVSTSAGTPIGTPTAFSGRAPIHWDSTGGTLYVYDSGWNAIAAGGSGDITRVNITAGIGLLGDLDTTSGAHIQTLDFDATSLTALTSGLLASDHVVVSDGTVSKKALVSGINLGIFNNDQGWTNNVGTVTAVTGTSGVASTGGATPAISLDLNGLAQLASGLVATDHIAVSDGTVSKKALVSGINLGIFNNDQGWTASVGTVTAVTGGVGIASSGGATPDITLALSELATSTADGDGDFFVVVDGAGAQKKLTKANIALSGFNNDAGFLTSAGDINRVDITAGIGLVGDKNTTSGDHIQTIDFSATSLGALASGLLAGDHIVVSDGTVSKKALISGINLGIFNNDQGWTTAVGTVTDVTGGTGIDSSGGATPDLTLDLSELAEITSGLLTTDHLAVVDAGVSKKALVSGINLGIFNNDQGWTTAVGTVTDVTGGVGIDSTGGATPSLTLDLSELAELASGLLTTDHIAVVDNGVSKKALLSGINLSLFINDAGWTTAVGTVTDVTGGTGIDSSGGATPDLTLDLAELGELASGLAATDHLAVVDGGVSKKALISGIPLSIFDNDLGGGGGPDYAGILMHKNITIFTPPLANSWEQLRLFFAGGDMPDAVSTSDGANHRTTIGSTGDYMVSFSASAVNVNVNTRLHFTVFSISATTFPITAITKASTSVVSATGHTFSNGDRVKITGVNGMVEVNDRIFLISNVVGNNFVIKDDTNSNINTTSFGTYVSAGTASLVTDIEIHTEFLYAAAGFGASQSAAAIVALTSGETLELHIKSSGTGNATVTDAHLTLLKVS